MILRHPRSALFPYTTLFRSGTALLDGYRPDEDATVVERVLDAGATILGKSVCESLCFSGGSHTAEDRKSTRLNSSHSSISYAVFCLKKKKSHHNHTCTHRPQ